MLFRSRTVGDLLVAAFFDGNKPKERERLARLYIEETLLWNDSEEPGSQIASALDGLRHSKKIIPLHWELAFPDAFNRQNPGFDAVVGNPPFSGGHLITGSFGTDYFAWLTTEFYPAGHHCDLVAYFLRRAYQTLRAKGALGLLTTDSICKGDTRNGGLEIGRAHV